MESISGGIVVAVAFVVAFAIARVITKRREAKAAAQEQLRNEKLKQDMLSAAPSKNKSKRRRQERMKQR